MKTITVKGVGRALVTPDLVASAVVKNNFNFDFEQFTNGLDRAA